MCLWLSVSICLIWRNVCLGFLPIFGLHCFICIYLFVLFGFILFYLQLFILFYLNLFILFALHSFIYFFYYIFICLDCIVCFICVLCELFVGEGNDTPLKYSCLENPMDGGVWWAAVHGVAKSQTGLKRLSSSSSMSCLYILEINHLSMALFANIFSHSVGCLFTLSLISIAM